MKRRCQNKNFVFIIFIFCICIGALLLNPERVLGYTFCPDWCGMSCCLLFGCNCHGCDFCSGEYACHKDCHCGAPTYDCYDWGDTCTYCPTYSYPENCSEGGYYIGEYNSNCVKDTVYSHCSGGFCDPRGCTGSATLCTSFTDESSCNAQSGCSWISYKGGAYFCAGTATPCSNYTDKTACLGQSGCDWPEPLKTYRYIGGQCGLCPFGTIHCSKSGSVTVSPPPSICYVVDNMHVTNGNITIKSGVTVQIMNNSTLTFSPGYSIFIEDGAYILILANAKIQQQ